MTEQDQKPVMFGCTVGDGVSWTQRGTDIDGEATNDQSGISVCLSSDGSILAIGAARNDGNGSNSGHVRVYSWDGASWLQRGIDIDGEAAGDNSGYSLCLSSNGSILGVGAPANNGTASFAGHARVYSWNGISWNQVDSDMDGEALSDVSGWSVSLSSNGGVVAIGAQLNDGAGPDAGHVRVYENFTILEVKLLSCLVQSQSQHIKIEWTSSNEKAGDYYIVSRQSESGVEIEIAQIQANNLREANYTIIDEHVPTGMYYYTLQQYNSSGELEVEEIRVVFHQNGINIQVYSIQPNVYHITSAEAIQGFVIYSVNGKMIHEQTEMNSRDINIDLNQIITTPGVYLLIISAHGVETSHRITYN